jgi:phosphoribosylanthranilate isomerase
MKIKICGMKQAENIAQVAALQPDFMGFIFYDKSKRYISLDDFLAINTDFAGVNKVGVFVNESIKNIIKIATLGNIKYLQLHGDETPEYCEELKYLDFNVIKAFGIDESFDFQLLNEYQNVCDYFLFDTKTQDYGGSGRPFDHTLLNQYKLSLPIFLSGGLDIQDIDYLYNLSLSQSPLRGVGGLWGLDFNSKLEDAPGLKNLEKVNN